MQRSPSPYGRWAGLMALAMIGVSVAGCAGYDQTAASPPPEQSAMLPGQTGCAYDEASMHCYAGQTSVLPGY